MAYSLTPEQSAAALALEISGNPSLRQLKNPTDRFCVSCGNAIRGFTKDKPVVCPFKLCKQPVPLMQAWFVFTNDMKWGRCNICCSFLRDDFCYCQSCGVPNKEALAKKRRFEAIEKEKQHIELKRLRQENEELRQKMMKNEAGNSAHSKEADEDMPSDEDKFFQFEDPAAGMDKKLVDGEEKTEEEETTKEKEKQEQGKTGQD